MRPGTNPYVFITGCTRSGTTLLQRMLDTHSDLAVSNDTHVIPRALFGVHAGPDTALTPEMFAQVVNYKRFPSLGIDVALASLYADESRTYAEFASLLFDEYAKRRQKALAGEKDPEYVRRLPLIHRLFPNARVVHIIRDGRDVALSTLEWVTPSRYLGKLPLWQTEPVAVCALWWARQVSSGMKGGDAIGDHYLEVRYEQLVSDPESTLRATCEFLQIAFDPAMLRYHEGRAHSRRDRSTKARWLPPTAGIRDWRTDLSTRDLQLFEALAGDLLATLGYPPAPVGSAAADIRATAERCRGSWLSETAGEQQGTPLLGSQAEVPASGRIAAELETR